MKYLASVALLGWLVASVCWGLGLLWAPAAAVATPPPQDSARQQQDLQQQLQTVREDQVRLQALHTFNKTGLSSRDWPTLVALPHGLKGGASAAALAPQPAPMARTLSMIYISQGFQRAVIDGAYVAPGSVLPGGARVARIDADRVVVREPWGDQVLRLARAHGGGP